MKKLIGLLFLLSFAGFSFASNKMKLTCQLPYNDPNDPGKVEVIFDFNDLSIKGLKLWTNSSDRTPSDYINGPMKVSSNISFSDDNLKVIGNVQTDSGDVTMIEFLPIVLDAGLGLAIGKSYQNKVRLENCNYKKFEQSAYE